ncbi:MAG: zf-HC2 domain-containing protein [Actinomycetes bacterium]
MEDGGRRLTRRFVRRLDAERYMRLMLIGFAGTLLGTRAYLALTGYPQIGGGVLHIAHALWGGLLLMVAALVPLLAANRSALVWSALVTGVGAGLFVDEVGKFITADNDYFFPAAAPIAYGVFLLCLWVYLRARRRRDLTPRAQLYAAVELLTDALDHDLSPSERVDLERHLRAAAHQAQSDELARLADTLLDLTQPGVLPVTSDDPGLLRRLGGRLRASVDRLFSDRRLQQTLVAALTLLGLLAVSDLVIIVAIAIDLADRSSGNVVRVANRFARVEIADERGVLLLLVRAGLDVLVGVTLLVAAWLLSRQHQHAPQRRRALGLAQGGLLTSVTVVNLLVFYLEQFVAAVFAVVQLTVLYGVQRYQRRLDRREE